MPAKPIIIDGPKRPKAVAVRAKLSKWNVSEAVVRKAVEWARGRGPWTRQPGNCRFWRDFRVSL
jgi:hypothetical protein